MSYSYNKCSFRFSSNMSSRGRGFSSRGGSSYRGRGGSSGNEWNSSAGGNMSSRGGYSSSRGSRFKYPTTSYDSRSKYDTGGSERYPSRGGRGEHNNSYKRPRDSYPPRDDHRSSSDSARKRMRSDSYQGGGSGSGSQRYSSSYGGSSASAPYDDNKGSSSSAVYDDKRQSERASSYHRSEDRHSASRSYAPPPPPRISEMAPPAQRYTSSRGRISHQSSNYRGRISTRGSSRGGGFHRISSRSDVIMARKRTLHSLDYRRKLLGSRSRDYIQRVRMTTKLRRSSGTTRLSGSKKETGSGTSMKDKDREMTKAINAEFSDDEEDDDNKSNWDDDEKPHERDDEEEEDEKEEEEKKKKDEKRKKDKQDRERQNTEDEEEKEDEVKEDDDDHKHEDDEDDGDDDEDRDENDKTDHGRTTGSEELPSRRDGRKFIKLTCPHCAHRSVTFKEYSLHLYSGRHSAAMRRIASRHKATLTRMRVLQRQEQRRVEARDAARGTLPSRTMFCPICKLNYRSLKAVHQLSDSHRQMKRFLTPFCRTCRIQFRSPMLFETHMCSLDHIKRKSALKERLNAGNGEAEADSSGPEEDDKEVNLDNFMTLDSVGDVDDEESPEKKKEKPESEGTNEAEKKPKSKQMIKVGAEYIKRVEVQFCELCKVYLPRSENSERAIALHCSTRSHLKRYVRDNDDKALRRQAERIHLQSSSTNNTTTLNVMNNTESTKSPTNLEPPSASNTLPAATTDGINTNESGKVNEQKGAVEPEKIIKDSKNAQPEEDDDDDFVGDGGDKLWDDVDKDLGEILREAEAAAKSSDDEDSRYDRFRNSDKKQQHSGKDKESETNETDEKENTIKPETKIKTEKIDM
ncbi:uncharacterized protein LOC108632776 isoform X3 [Ceratina calcarata]|uniref:Uncharacterized protein LOC108632776 isoform X3 n=1 Tax=Ceratina calcarata TaxID=156304 RepID=A0AAJ7JH31_9HYME|nr:uncharacterized protein LOC108632776 isoform X3 [Ceratina calcarata]